MDDLHSFGGDIIGRHFRIKFELELPLIVLLLLFVAVAKRLALLGQLVRALPALFRLTSLPVLINAHLAGLLNRVLHHLLLFEPLANVVAIEAQVALLAKAE